MTGLLLLYYEFFKVGLFAIGGGLATLPFLYDLAARYDWFTREMISDMIAISESTPGPIGINMATYTGFQNSGPVGAVAATLGLITPSIIIVIIIAQFLKKFSENKLVQDVFYSLRPAVTGLIGAVAVSLILGEVIDQSALGAGFMEMLKFKEILWFILLVVLTNKHKKHPLFYVGISAAAGILFKF